MKKSLFALLLLFVLFSCDKAPDQKAPNKKVLTTRPVREVLPDDSISYTQLNPDIKPYIIKLDSTYDRTPYYSKLDHQYLFYVCKGKWTDSKNGSMKGTNSYLGIVNQNYEVMLPVEYSKLYNPDGTVEGYIEIEKGEKKGLFNYTTHKIIAPQFEVIFPSHVSEYLAFGKNGDDYYSITADAVQKYEGELPTYAAQKWYFDIKGKQILYLHNSYLVHYENEPSEGDGIIFTPSYLYQLQFLPEIVEYINTEDNQEFGLVATEGKIVESASITDKISALITSFYEEGVDGRGWEIKENTLVVVDNKNKVLSSEKILNSPDYGSLYYCGDDLNGFSYLENGLVEVYEILYTNEKMDAPLPYTRMTFYSYYQINEQGEIQKMNSTRFFDFTKYRVLKEEHFAGCYSISLEEPVMVDGEDKNMWLSRHLSIEDLEFMKNEIYAEYGFIFKTEKWKKYFNAQSWYKPQYENVDRFMSETDKQNIKLIIETIEKMRADEKEFTQKELVLYSPAG